MDWYLDTFIVGIDVGSRFLYIFRDPDTAFADGPGQH
jgi:hypothetical protein